MKVTQTSTTSTDTLPVRIPGASGHQPATLSPRPAFPAQAAPVKHLSHDLPHIPTARTAAGSYTRKTLTAAIEADASENDRWLPTLPGQRPSPEQPAPKVPGQRSSVYDREVLGFQYDGIAADAAFGGAA